MADGRFEHAVGLGHVVHDVQRGAVAQLQRAGAGAQTQDARAGGGIGVHDHGHGLTDLQLFPDHGLMWGMRGLDVEDEIAAGLVDLVLQVDGEVDANHGITVKKRVDGPEACGTVKDFA
ncbi:hypothetical protein D9M68_809110 [compost metagenome]